MQNQSSREKLKLGEYCFHADLYFFILLTVFLTKKIEFLMN